MPFLPMKSGQESSSPIAVAGNLGEVKWLKLRFASPRHWNTIAQGASGLDVARLGNGTLTSDERICRKFEEQ